MSYRTLMVHLDLDHSNDSRLKITGDLAERFDATVIGIAACSQTLPVYYNDGFISESFVDQDQIEIKKRLALARERFESALKGRTKKIEWRSAMLQPTVFVADESRAADLIIIGSYRKSDSLDPLRQLIPGDLVTSAGRPVLALPQETESLNAQRIMIAWKDTRESRRAVLDALPLLKTCQKATVVEIDEDNDRATAQGHVDDVAAWLERQGVKAGALVQDSFAKTQEQINNIASGIEADLIVAGAYGHSRLREWVLGGVTRDLLSKATCSTIFSH